MSSCSLHIHSPWTHAHLNMHKYMHAKQTLTHTWTKKQFESFRRTRFLPCMCMCMCTYVCVMYVHVCVPIRKGQRRTWCFLSYPHSITPTYVLETGYLTEHGVRSAAWKSQQSPCLCSRQCWGYRGVCLTSPNFLHGFQIPVSRSSDMQSKCSCLQGQLKTTVFLISKHNDTLKFL